MSSSALDGQGRLVVVGGQNASNGHSFIARFDRSGQLDTTFAGQGFLAATFSATSDYAGAVTRTVRSRYRPRRTKCRVLPSMDRAASCVVGGQNASNGHSFIARFDRSGQLDTTFAGQGFLAATFSATSDYAGAVAIDGQQRILVAGFTPNTSFVARLSPDGALDLDVRGGKPRLPPGRLALDPQDRAGAVVLTPAS